jgi:hypothetical protein
MEMMRRNGCRPAELLANPLGRSSGLQQIEFRMGIILDGRRWSPEATVNHAPEVTHGGAKLRQCL